MSIRLLGYQTMYPRLLEMLSLELPFFISSCQWSKRMQSLPKFSPYAEHSEWPSEFLTPSCSSGNLIHTVTGLDPRKLISLHTLELRGNQLNSTLGINLPKLKKLYLVAHWVRGWLVQGTGHCPEGQDPCF